jgi:MFS family permease
MFSWYSEVSKNERRTFWACFGGWALDALDVQMFSLVIPAIIAEWGISKTQAGLVSGVTLIASALGGWICGAAADRFGRVRTLQITVAWFSVFTLLSAFAQNFPEFIVLKALQGFGFGGEWAAGAVLMAETIRNQHRGKVMGAVQSAWAIGWAAAVLLYAGVFSFLPPAMGWRVMFAVGIVPALLVIYIRRNIQEPVTPAARLMKDGNANTVERVPLLSIFAPDVLRMTLIGGLLGVGAHGGYAALTTWLPTFLKTERHLSVLGTGGYLAVIILAFFCGCLAASVLYVFLPMSNHAMLALGFPLGFFAAGIPASMGALFNELYPRGTRGTGVGFCYNFGRVVSAGFPVLVGHLAAQFSLGFAIGISAAVAYAIVAVSIMMLPETRGRTLDEEPAA